MHSTSKRNSSLLLTSLTALTLGMSSCQTIQPAAKDTEPALSEAKFNKDSKKNISETEIDEMLKKLKGKGVVIERN